MGRPGFTTSMSLSASRASPVLCAQAAAPSSRLKRCRSSTASIFAFSRASSASSSSSELLVGGGGAVPSVIDRIAREALAEAKRLPMRVCASFRLSVLALLLILRLLQVSPPRPVQEDAREGLERGLQLVVRVSAWTLRSARSQPSDSASACQKSARCGTARPTSAPRGKALSYRSTFQKINLERADSA